MTETEFRDRFYAYWKQKYPLAEKHSVKEFMISFHEESKVKMFLKAYAQNVQECGISRIKNNKAQRIFDELGIDPKSIEFKERRF